MKPQTPVLQVPTTPDRNEQVQEHQPKPKKRKKKKPVQSVPLVNGPLNEGPPVIYQKKIVINTSRSEYPLIDQVAKEVMGWRGSKEEDFLKGDFDLWWSDLNIDGNTL